MLKALAVGAKFNDLLYSHDRFYFATAIIDGKQHARSPSRCKHNNQVAIYLDLVAPY